MSSTESVNSPVLEQYLYYLSIIKGRTENTINEYRNDLISMFRFINESRKAAHPDQTDNQNTCYDLGYIKSITINELYSFIAHRIL